MTANGILFVSKCPMSESCGWESAPQSSTVAAFEAVRAHTSEHRHGDLVDFLVKRNLVMTTYTKTEQP